MKGDPFLEEILRLVEEIRTHGRQSERKARQQRKRLVSELDTLRDGFAGMAAAVDALGEGTHKTQQAVAALQASTLENSLAVSRLSESTRATDRAVGRLRAELDQSEAGTAIQNEYLGRLARAMNTLADGHALRLDRLEARLDRLEQSA